MLDQSLLQSHFIGRDGFRWWIGQIPPVESMGKQLEGGGWGNRFKVRILGYHPYSEAELSNEDLPWAQCLVPTTSGTGAANCSTGVQLQPGDVVLGFFLDGDNAQIPVILAAFGRTESVPSKTYRSPFEAFTGYSNLIKSNPGTQENQSNEQTAQPTPRDLSPEQIERIATGEISVSEALGEIVVLADPVGNTKVAAIKSEITNLLEKIRTLQNDASRVRQEITRTVDTITSISNDFVGVGFNFLYNTLIPILQKALKLLYDQVFAAVLAATGNPAIAHLAGVAAQTAMVIPIKKLEEGIYEIANKIVNENIRGFVTELLNSTIGNIDRFTSSVELQFTSTLLNSIVDLIETGLDDRLSAINKLLQFFPNFTVGNTLRSSINSIQSIGAAFDVNQSKENFQGLITEWMIGANPIDMGTNSFQKILDSMNIQNSGSSITQPINVVNDAGTNLGGLYSIIKITDSVTETDNIFKILNSNNLIEGSVISPTTKNINNELMLIQSINKENNTLTVNRQYAGISTAYSFGQEFYVFSSKSEILKTKNNVSTEENLIASYSKTISAIDTKRKKYASTPTVRIFGGGRGKGAEAIPLMGKFITNSEGFTTGSIIGFKVTNPGSDYKIPPFVEVLDDEQSPQGYGVVARAVIKDGKVTGIYVISEGENYTAISNEQDYSVVDIIIENGGNNYDNNTTVTDQFNNNYPVRVFEGSIISISTLNNSVNDKPIFTINSTSGSGAILLPIVGELVRTSRNIQKSIDCPT